MSNGVRVLHVFSGSLTGGASRGALSLHESMLRSGTDSKCLVPAAEDEIEEVGVEQVFSMRAEHEVVESFKPYGISRGLKALYPESDGTLFSSGFDGYDFTKSIHYNWADVIHLHWISRQCAPVSVVRSIAKPIVWTLRDMWPFTGGCHYTFQSKCEAFKDACGRCPQLASDDPFDLSHLGLQEKMKGFSSTVYPVGISKWMAGEAKKSQLFRGTEVRMIYNSIDTELFRPVERSDAWRAIGKEDPECLVIGFGAAGAGVGDERKGYALLKRAIEEIAQETQVKVLCFGRDGDFGGVPVINLGVLKDANDVRNAYACCDLFAAPSLQEAFGKTVAEAQSVGRPVICFEETGCSEVIEHTVTGYAAEYGDWKDLAEGIRWVLSLNPVKRSDLAKKSRERMCEKFDCGAASQEYLTLYQEIMDEVDLSQIVSEQKLRICELVDEIETLRMERRSLENTIRALKEGDRGNVDKVLEFLRERLPGKE